MSSYGVTRPQWVYTMSWQNDCHFVDDNFKLIFVYYDGLLSVWNSPSYVSIGLITNTSIGLDYGLVLVRRQAIIWSHEGLVATLRINI